MSRPEGKFHPLPNLAPHGSDDATGLAQGEAGGASRPFRLRRWSGLKGLRLDADRQTQRLGDRLAEALDVGVVFGFDHDASKRLGTGIT
jgi:hypothetical protein